MYGGNVEDLVGKTFFKVSRLDEGEDYGQEIRFYENIDTEPIVMAHYQDWCERVYIEDICGELADLEGTPILQAEVVTNNDDPPAEGSDECYTWTFYKLATIKGSVTIRWFGSSNGYYSEAVDLFFPEQRR